MITNKYSNWKDIFFVITSVEEIQSVILFKLNNSHLLQAKDIIFIDQFYNLVVFFYCKSDLILSDILFVFIENGFQLEKIQFCGGINAKTFK